MLRAMAWADQQVLAAVRDAPQAHAEVLPLLAHIVAAEHIWLSRLRYQPATHAVWPQLTLSECETLAAENAAGFLVFVTGLNEAEFATPVTYHNSKGDEFVTPVIDILTQVITHGPYHRGQIAKALARNGYQPPNTDYITFVRTAESGPAKPDAAS